MPKETSLREVLKRAMDVRPAQVITGTVTSASPLEIQAESDAKLLLDEDDLFVPQALTDHTVKIRFDGTTAEAKIYNGLKKGDEVYLLEYDRGALYFVLDKVG